MRCSVRRAYRVKAAAVGGVSSVAETAAYETRQSATASFLAIIDECAIGEYSGSVDHAENQNFLHFVPGARGADRTQLQAIFVGGQGREREVELVDTGRQWFRDRLQLAHDGATAVEQARRDHRLHSGRAIGRHAHEQALGAAERARRGGSGVGVAADLRELAGRTRPQDLRRRKRGSRHLEVGHRDAAIVGIERSPAAALNRHLDRDETGRRIEGGATCVSRSQELFDEHFSFAVDGLQGNRDHPLVARRLGAGFPGDGDAREPLRRGARHANPRTDVRARARGPEGDRLGRAGFGG